MAVLLHSWVMAPLCILAAASVFIFHTRKNAEKPWQTILTVKWDLDCFNMLPYIFSTFSILFSTYFPYISILTPFPKYQQLKIFPTKYQRPAGVGVIRDLVETTAPWKNSWEMYLGAVGAGDERIDGYRWLAGRHSPLWEVRWRFWI